MNYSDIQKDKIRNKYKGINPDELDVIHAIPHVNLHDDTKEKRVAVYARVSTDDSSQTSSYELQKNHYIDVVNTHVGWKLVNIYADEGISGSAENPILETFYVKHGTISQYNSKFKMDEFIEF